MCILENDTAFDDCQHGEIRLERGLTKYEGTVKICYNNVWGTICDLSWSSLDARVACAQAGYPGAGRYMKNAHIVESDDFNLVTLSFIAAFPLSNSYFGVESGPMILSGFTCRGSETSLLDCGYTIPSTSCDQYDIAGVICEGLHTINVLVWPDYLQG